ncbi:MAG: hypothetical protein K2L23_02125 [Odoribacter sp.]|nr:hypothetical protein [Odoribacter sp.]
MKEISEKRLIYLKTAYDVQQIAKPYKDKGGMSENYIYFNFVVEKVPVCINTFRKMMKEDVSNLPQLIKAYKRKQQERYRNYLYRQSRKRIRGN